MSVKSKLLEEIEAKSSKIRSKRIDAAANKSVEVAIFDFFKNIEESRLPELPKEYNSRLFSEAKWALRGRVRGVDSGADISIEFNADEGSLANSWQQSQVRGVTVWWSKEYIAANNVDPSMYIDISRMLFL